MNHPAKGPKVRILRFFIGLIGAGLGLCTLFYFTGSAYIRAFLPLIAWEMEAIHPEYDLKALYLDDKQDILYRVQVHRETVDDTGKVWGIKELKGGIMGKTMFISPIIVYALLLVWPGLKIKERATAFLVSTPFFVGTQFLDIPIHLINRIEMSWPVSSWTEEFRVFWVHVVNNGGRQFSALLVVLLSVASVRAIFPRAIKPDLSRIGRNDPCPCGSGKKYKMCCLQK